MKQIKQCPSCQGKNIYFNRKGIAGGGYAANYLPGLGAFMQCAKLYPAVCRDCGLVSFYADEDARSKLGQSPKWERQ